MTIDNLLSPEPAIVARVTETMMTGASAVLRAVLTKKELAAIVEEKQTVPAVHVVFDGFAVAGSGVEAETVVNQVQRWMTVVAVANASKMRESAALNQDAGPLLAKLWKALHGYKPGKEFSPLVPISPPRAYYSAAFAYFPLAWSTTVTMCQNSY